MLFGAFSPISTILTLIFSQKNLGPPDKYQQIDVHDIFYL